MAYNVTGLTDYVKQNEKVLIKDIVLGIGSETTASKMRKQLGIKTTERMNYLDVDPKLKDGSDCGFTADGDSKFTERDIKTVPLKVNESYCERDLLGKFAEHLVSTGADSNGMPFEQEITDGIVKGVRKQIEKAIWQGIADPEMKGLIQIADDGGADNASTVKVSIPSGTTAYDAIEKVYMAIPEDIIDDAVIFVSPALFRQFTNELVSKNLYHYPSVQNEVPVEFIFPGSNTPVRKTQGLTGADKKIYASTWSNMVYGTDLMNDAEIVKVWYDEKDEDYKVKVRFNLGVNTLYPDMVVLGTIANA